jgi:ubiquinone/menaquinone biosynthesis C-methylase UbiE
METFLWIIGGVIIVIAALGLLRWLARARPQPCPTWLIGCLNNPFSGRYRAAVLAEMELAAGLSILDAGCGPGLQTVPLAQAVGPQGHVTGLDIQAGMLERAQAAVDAAGLTNVSFIQAGLGQGRLPAAAFDRALLLTVLGEIPDKAAALRELATSLKPGGFLSVTEVFFDPDYQSRRRVEALGRAAGLRVRNVSGNWFRFTMNLEK